MPQRGRELGLSEDEMGFYDALVDHGGVKEVMEDKVLAAIAHDLVAAIRRSVPRLDREGGRQSRDARQGAQAPKKARVPPPTSRRKPSRPCSSKRRPAAEPGRRTPDQSD